ncbi:hypothetical protein J2Z44_003857 [Clostridium punense]|uniref:Uncharacterized protein n=2 Tax=Clostridium TaxID=1485 RepID=A0ABS4K8B0_9CLOT|nr:hypothetical protein [Clostridium punense]MBP2024007.1 hypothetical protein [Clostridium punense]
MFPTSNTFWIEEPISTNRESEKSNSILNFITEPEKIFYYIDSEDIAFRMKLNYFPSNSNSIVIENKTWGINVHDNNSKKLLFSLQLNDNPENCTIELLDENKIIRSTLEGVIHNPAQQNDNIKIIIIQEKVLGIAESKSEKVVSFYLDFRFPNKLIYKSIPKLIGKDLNCYLSYYVLDKDMLDLEELHPTAKTNEPRENTSSMPVLPLEQVNLLIEENLPKTEMPLINSDLKDSDLLVNKIISINHQALEDRPLCNETQSYNQVNILTKGLPITDKETSHESTSKEFPS